MPYSTQSDLEVRLSRAVLAQLLTDLKNVLIPPSPRCAVHTVAAAGIVTLGDFKYRVTFVNALGEESIDSEDSNVATVVSATFGRINILDIPAAPAGYTDRNLYRTLAGGSIFYLLHTMGDATTQVYHDVTPDATLSANAQLTPFICKGVAELIARADAQIDAFAGQIYAVPFVPTPPLVKTISVDLACYFAMQRRYSEQTMPADWVKVWEHARADLQRIADEEVDLNVLAPIVSGEADIVANPQTFTFNDTTTQMSQF